MMVNNKTGCLVRKFLGEKPRETQGLPSVRSPYSPAAFHKREGGCLGTGFPAEQVHPWAPRPQSFLRSKSWRAPTLSVSFLIAVTPQRLSCNDRRNVCCHDPFSSVPTDTLRRICILHTLLGTALIEARAKRYSETRT